MRETEYITPRVGLRSVFILGLLLAGASVLTAKSASLGDAPFWESHVRITLDRWLAGIFYGLAVGGCWMATVVNDRYIRWLLRSGLVVGLVAVKHELDPLNWLRDFSNLGGLVLAQCMLFFLMRVPSWQRGDEELEMPGNVPAESPTRQFGIGDVGITTAVVAVLLAIGIRYAPRIDSLVGYWSVLILAWLVGPIIAACIAHGILSRRGQFAVVMLAIAVLLAVGGVVGLSMAESHFSDDRPAPTVSESRQILVALYGRVVIGYFVTVAIFAIAGRVQGFTRSQHNSSQAELDS